MLNESRLNGLNGSYKSTRADAVQSSFSLITYQLQYYSQENSTLNSCSKLMHPTYVQLYVQYLMDVQLMHY